MRLIDAHIHLDFYDNIEQILYSIMDKDIELVFVTHLPELFERYQAHMSLYSNVTLALGFHPILIREYELNEQLFLQMKNSAKFIGEVGLDYSITSSQSLRKKQRDVFDFICKHTDEQILSIHSRLADEDILRILIENGVKKAVFHWYTGGEQLISRIVDAGYFVSANHMMLRSSKGINILKQIPLDRLLIETDGPFTKYGGSVVLPSDLCKIYKEFSDFYQRDDIVKIIYENYSRLTIDS